MTRPWRRMLGALVVGLCGGLGIAALLLKHQPAIVRIVFDGPAAERAAARLITKGSALREAIRQGGAWGAVVADEELNAWLATDLPRNHPRLLPGGFSDPRVRFRPHHVEAAIRIGSGLLSTVVWCDLQVALRGVNQVGISVVSASAGAVPLPATPVLAEIGRRLAVAGCVTELRRLDGRMVLVVYIPVPGGGGGPDWRLESLSIGAGEAIMSGATRGPVAR